MRFPHRRAHDRRCIRTGGVGMSAVSIEAHASSLRAAGLGDDAVASWVAAQAQQTTEFETDRTRYSGYFLQCDDLLQRLPPKRQRNDAEAAAATAVLTSAREHRERFLAAHAEALYDRLTRNRSRFLRLDALVMEAATFIPGLTPRRAQLMAETSKLQRDKDGIEIDQGIFLAHVLASERAGTHLCHAMLLPRPESIGLLAKLATDGSLDLGATSLQRQGKAIVVTASNPRLFLAGRTIEGSPEIPTSRAVSISAVRKPPTLSISPSGSDCSPVQTCPVASGLILSSVVWRPVATSWTYSPNAPSSSIKS